MSIFVALVLGLLLGLAPACRSWHKGADRLLVGVTAVIVFAMGVSLGQREGFWEQLSALGVRSLVFSLIPMALSVLAVQLAARWLLGKKGAKQ